MKHSLSILWMASLLCMGPLSLSAKNQILYSPDGKLRLEVTPSPEIRISIFSGDSPLFSVDNIRMGTDKGFIPAENVSVSSVKTKEVRNTVIPEIKEKQAAIPENYNELMITFKDKTQLQLRAYNEGVAYRLKSGMSGSITIENEWGNLLLDPSDRLIFQQDSNMNSDYESSYVTKRVGELDHKAMGNLPALLQKSDGKCILLMESDVVDYPVLWVKKGDKGLQHHFWPYPKSYNDKGNSFNRRRIVQVEDYIAQTEGSRWFPWRVYGVAEKERDLLTNQLVYLLAPPCKIEDVSWIKPGWVTFDWWAKDGIYGVDFKSGVNTETAKYMIDFAAEYGIRYFLFDDGWTADENLTKVIPGLNMPEVVRHADEKGVDVMLWVTFDLFDSQMEAACKQFKEWGIKGVKIDFINRSDQEASRFYRKAAEICAKYQMVIDFHGCYRPDGLRREYPNVLTREALIEFEYNGVSERDSPDHHCFLPFIRNVVGPMDYIPATTNNASKKEFRQVGHRPMGQGTRSHAMAMAVIAESPMQMLPDGPSDYYREDECTRFITQIPVEWDEMIPIDGQLGDYVVLARRRGSSYYAAAITDWDARSLQLSFDFLPADKEFNVELFRDGANAHIRGIDYKREIKRVKRGDKWTLDLASGGGFVARIFE